jgi:hypothetical protein
VVRAEWIRTPNLTVKSGLLFPLSYARFMERRRLRGQGSHLHRPVSRTGELPVTQPRSGAWRRLRTADLRVTRAMLLPSELSRHGRRAESRTRTGYREIQRRRSSKELSRLGLGGGPRSRTTGLEGQHAACLRPLPGSCLQSGRHDSNVHEPSDSTALEAVAAADFATPGSV